MNTENKTTAIFEDVKVNVKIIISALWIAVMFLYVYVDIFAFFEPGALEHILDGKVWVLDITQTWAISGLIMMTIPTLMIFLSLVLRPRANRWTNIIVAVLYLLISIGNSIGETWLYFYFGSAVESVLLALIVWNAWRWPKQEA